MNVFLKSLLTVTILSVISVSHASEGIYLGFNLGRASYDADLNDFAALNDGTLTSESLDDTDSSYHFTIGYQLLPYFSLEGGYIDFGVFGETATSNGTGIYAPGNFSAMVTTDGFFVDAKVIVPIYEQFSLYGTYGLLSWESQSRVRDSQGTVVESATDDNDTFYGLGGSFNIYNDLAVNVDYTFYKLDELDVEVLSVGIQFGY